MAYLPLSTANLPDPVIDPAQGASPEDYFGIDTYSGTSATHERSALQFQPDFVWIKERNNAGLYHCLFDSIRGATNILYSNDTSAEATNANTLTSFDSDGFTLGNDSNNYGVNRSVGTYVAWSWKANGSGVTNTDGSITSTVSANTTSGFSIVEYTSPNTTNVESIGHGLTQAPDMVICKNRNNTYNWDIWHKDLTQGSGHGLMFNTNAQTAGRWPNSVVTDSLVYLAYNFEHYSTNDYIAYCFHSVEGFSKFGSYVGNGSADGPFVYTGFRPSWIMIKSSTNSSTPWQIFDATRETFNTVEQSLIANGANAEPYDTASPVDFLSNGFKLRGGGSSWNNYNTGTWIYACFSEQPFKYSNAR